MAILAIYGPYGHDQRLNQYARYGYPGKELKHTNSTSQIYIVKMAIFYQFYLHRKEWSYRDFKDIFENGMACGQRWQHGITWMLTLVFIRIALGQVGVVHQSCLEKWLSAAQYDTCELCRQVHLHLH